MRLDRILFAVMVPVTAAGIACADVNTNPTAPTVPQQSTQQSTLAPVLSIQISPPVESMRIGETLSFSVTVELGDGVPPSGPMPSWSSTNPAVIRIEPHGNATAVGKGAATIEVIFKGHTTMRTVHVAS
jgi:hypothetical protein